MFPGLRHGAAAALTAFSSSRNRDTVAVACRAAGTGELEFSGVVVDFDRLFSVEGIDAEFARGVLLGGGGAVILECERAGEWSRGFFRGTAEHAVDGRGGGRVCGEPPEDFLESLQVFGRIRLCLGRGRQADGCEGD